MTNKNNFYTSNKELLELWHACDILKKYVQDHKDDECDPLLREQFRSNFQVFLKVNKTFNILKDTLDKLEERKNEEDFEDSLLHDQDPRERI